MSKLVTQKERREALIKSLVHMKETPAVKHMVELLLLLLDQKVSVLINSTGEEAVALRGEIRCIKRLLSVLEQGNTPLSDLITQ